MELRDEFRAWLRENLTDALREPSASRAARLDAAREWQRRLHAGGWIAPGWPREWGGRDATPAEVAAYHEEIALAGAPNPINSIGVWNIGPMLLRFASDEQKRRWLPPMLSGEEIWCQGFSEPDAGSDLASLRTRAEPADDEDFVVNGRKVWTTYADLARWCLALVRTGPDKHRGISALVVDMTASGVEVSPIREITGEEGFNEILFDDVRVPARNLVGALNEGWDAAVSTLTHERLGTTTLAFQLRRQLDDLVDLARRVQIEGRPAIEDPLVRDRLARLHVEVEQTRLLAAEALEMVVRGSSPAVHAAIGKIQWASIWQQIAECAVEIQGALGPAGGPGAADAGRWQRALLFSRMTTIGAGTTEIQRNILARAGLDLPRSG